jgi:hypothetical protein
MDHQPGSLDGLRLDQSGVCWWCGGVGDSREHKHKASVLRRMWGAEGLSLGREGHDLHELRSWRSGAVKFGKVLCQKCNNERSQPFDEAYDVYEQFIQHNSARLSRSRVIDWRDVFGHDWEVQTRLLGCYAVKMFGCWIANDGFPPPKALVTFLDGGDLLDTRLMLERQQSASLAHRAIRLDGESDFNRGIGVLGSHGWFDPQGTCLIGYERYAYISDICMRFNWADRSGMGDLFWTGPTTPLALMPASFSQRRLAVQIGVRALGRRLRRVLKPTD